MPQILHAERETLCMVSWLQEMSRFTRTERGAVTRIFNILTAVAREFMKISCSVTTIYPDDEKFKATANRIERW